MMTEWLMVGGVKAFSLALPLSLSQITAEFLKTHTHTHTGAIYSHVLQFYLGYIIKHRGARSYLYKTGRSGLNNSPR